MHMHTCVLTLRALAARGIVDLRPLSSEHPLWQPPQRKVADGEAGGCDTGFGRLKPRVPRRREAPTVRPRLWCLKKA